MLTKRIYLIIFILCLSLIYFCIRESTFIQAFSIYTSTLKSQKTEDVRSSEDQSDTEFQVISQTKTSYSEEGV